MRAGGPAEHLHCHNLAVAATGPEIYSVPFTVPFSESNWDLIYYDHSYIFRDFLN